MTEPAGGPAGVQATAPAGGSRAGQVAGPAGPTGSQAAGSLAWPAGGPVETPAAAAAPLSAPEVRTLVDHLRWAGREVRGGMDPYIRVRMAAQSDAYRRVADEVERMAPAGKAALLALAAVLRERCLNGEVPPDVQLPQWPAHRPVPALDAARVRREQQIGFGLGLAQCAARIHVAAGGHV